MRARRFGIGLVLLWAAACGDDDGSEAIRSGVGDACEVTDDCEHNDQACLTEFKGGYCGLRDCESDVECPDGSACVTHAGANYCFLICAEKVDCNLRRSVEDESNCSSSAEFVDDTLNRKACVPPSGT
jgi:hypothetical protein